MGWCWLGLVAEVGTLRVAQLLEGGHHRELDPVAGVGVPVFVRGGVDEM